jgi:hypothetical protein
MSTDKLKPPAAIAGVVERLAELHDGLGPAYSTSFRLQLGSLVDQLRAAMKQGEEDPCGDCHGLDCEIGSGVCLRDKPAPKPADGELFIVQYGRRTTQHNDDRKNFVAAFSDDEILDYFGYDSGCVEVEILPLVWVGGTSPPSRKVQAKLVGSGKTRTRWLAGSAIGPRSDAVGEVEHWLRDLAEHMMHGNDGARDEAQEAILMADKLAGSGEVQKTSATDEPQSCYELEEWIAENTLCLACGGLAKYDDGLMYHQCDEQAAGDSKPEPHPDAAELADNERQRCPWCDAEMKLAVWAFLSDETPAGHVLKCPACEANGPVGNTEEKAIALGENLRTRRLQPQPAKVPGEVWLIGPKDADQFVSLGYTEQAAVEAWRGPYEFAELVPIHGAAEGECDGHNCELIDKWIAASNANVERTRKAEAERDQALADLAAEREAHGETKELFRLEERDTESLMGDCAHQRARAEKAERIIEEDNERLLLAQREIDGLRERVAELEKREEEAEDYYDVAAERDRLRERVGELEYDITRCDECIYHPNSEARCFGKVNPGPPEPPRRSTISGEEIDGSIQQALDDQEELSEQLDKSFGPVSDVKLRATRTGQESDGCPCDGCEHVVESNKAWECSADIPGGMTNCPKRLLWRASTTPCKGCDRKPYRFGPDAFMCPDHNPCSNEEGYTAAEWLAENAPERTDQYLDARLALIEDRLAALESQAAEDQDSAPPPDALDHPGLR